MDWLRKLFGIKTNFEIMLEHVERAHSRDLELIRAQMGTIDRVVVARYDRPVIAQHEPLPLPAMNLDDITDVNVDDDTWAAKHLS